MHSVHGSLSIAVKIRSGDHKNCEKFDQLFRDNENGIFTLLESWNAAPEQTFLKNCASVLCASAVIIPTQQYGRERLPCSLLFVTTFVGPLNNHIDELLDHGEEELRALFRFTEGFTEQEQNYRSCLKKFLLKHKTLDAFYSGSHHIRPIDIEREFHLKQRLKEIVANFANDADFLQMKATKIKSKILGKLENDPEFAWLSKENVRPGFKDWLLTDGVAVKSYLYIVLIFVGLNIAVYHSFKNLLKWPDLTACSVCQSFLLTLILLMGLTTILVLIGRFLEWKEPDITAERPNDNRLRDIANTQRHPVINELTAAGPVKPGGFRRFIYWLILKLALTVQYKPFIATVVSARWIGMDNCKRLVFVSNFANTAEFYVRDFIDSEPSAKGINLLFGHGHEYPKTKFLVNNGALADPEAFLNLFLKNQHITNFWYNPFKNYSVDNLLINRKIRVGLKTSMGEDAARAWLRLI